MKKFRLILASICLSLMVASCSLTEDGIVPQDQVLKSDGGLILPGPTPIPPPPPEPCKCDQ